MACEDTRTSKLVAATRDIDSDSWVCEHFNNLWGGRGGERWKGRGRTKKKKLEREVMGSKSAKHQNLRKISKFYFVKY